MRDKIWVNKSESLEDAQEFDDIYYLSMSEIERVETVQFLREEYWKMSKRQDYEDRKRLRRVFKTIKQT
jgi:hypothetical protein